jgi:Fe-S oxidoreductase
VVATHMHAGDGNVHVNIPVLSNDREMMQRARRAADLVMEQAVALGGVVSGEHGIGITKLRHLDPMRVRELAEYRRQVDPEGIMNPGKLSDTEVLRTVFTPSFNLLGLEAAILQHHSLKALAEKISRCVRCGKCKPDCCVFIPRESLFYHPRNKNLAVAALIEALLYQAQRFQSTRFESLKQLEEVADHCTICHKCLAPCPVDIDTAEVSVLEREILAIRRYKHTSLFTRLSLAYLVSRSRALNGLFRAAVLRWGVAVQRLAARLLGMLPELGGFGARWPLSLLRSPIPRPPRAALHHYLPRCLPNQAVSIEPQGAADATVFYFPGCGSERLYSDISRASLFILLETGARVVMPPPFLCCGFPLQVNAKRDAHAAQRLSVTIVFSQIREMLKHLDFDACVVSCGTCREELQSMGAPQIFNCRLVDVSEHALGRGLRIDGGGQCLYHRPCHDSLDGRALALLGRHGLAAARAVPHCCSEAGTLALSRPDISHKMLVRKATAIQAASPAVERGAPILTNCPTCIQGLGRNAHLGHPPRHLAVELARRTGGPQWERALRVMLRRAEVVNF